MKKFSIAILSLFVASCSDNAEQGMTKKNIQQNDLEQRNLVGRVKSFTEGTMSPCRWVNGVWEEIPSEHRPARPAIFLFSAEGYIEKFYQLAQTSEEGSLDTLASAEYLRYGGDTVGSRTLVYSHLPNNDRNRIGYMINYFLNDSTSCFKDYSFDKNGDTILQSERLITVLISPNQSRRNISTTEYEEGVLVKKEVHSNIEIRKKDEVISISIDEQGKIDTSTILFIERDHQGNPTKTVAFFKMPSGKIDTVMGISSYEYYE